jgi:hypothetical protein
MTGMWAIAFALQWILLLLLAVLMIGTLRYLGFVQRNIHLVTHYASRFDTGDHLSNFKLPSLAGLPVVSDILFDTNQQTILLFLSTTCSGCSSVISFLVNLVKKEGGLKKFGWSIVAVYTGPYTSREAVERHVAPELLNEITILVDEKGEIGQKYDIRSFPIGIAVNRFGRVIDQSARSVPKWIRETLQASQQRQPPSHDVSVIA